MENVESVKNVGGSLGGSLAHWFSVLWEMWKMLKMSVAHSVAPLLIGNLFIENVENVKNIGGSLGGSLAHWLSVL